MRRHSYLRNRSFIIRLYIYYNHSQSGSDAYQLHMHSRYFDNVYVIQISSPSPLIELLCRVVRQYKYALLLFALRGCTSATVL